MKECPNYGALQQLEIKAVLVRLERCCLCQTFKFKNNVHMHGVILCMFDCWAAPVVHLIKLKSSMPKVIQLVQNFFYLGSVCVNDVSITNFWITGFFKDEQSIVGVSTEFADYYLVSPHPDYLDIMRSFSDKVRQMILFKGILSIHFGVFRLHPCISRLTFYFVILSFQTMIKAVNPFFLITVPCKIDADSI